MGRAIPLAVLLLALPLPVPAQRSMTVSQLETFVKSSIELRHPDRQVADFLKNVRLTERLDARKVEELQGLGVGDRTLEALRALSAASAGLPAAPPPAPAVATVQIPPPSPEEQRAVLEEVRRNALDYTRGLPDFICTQRTRRFVDPGGRGWRLADTIQEQLSYVDNHENYRVVLINDLLVNNVSHEELGGTTTSGEFGTMLYQIFKPETQTEFRWTRWATLRGRRMHVYEFVVRQRNSEYSVLDQNSGRHMIAGYHGLIYADRDTRTVMRIKMDLDGMEDFPIKAVSLDLNYDFVEISGRQFVLPLRAEILSRSEGYQTRNEVQFARYQKFTADASIVFDIPEDIPPEALEEKPPVPDRQR
jgi:hypothetical protein